MHPPFHTAIPAIPTFLPLLATLLFLILAFTAPCALVLFNRTRLLAGSPPDAWRDQRYLRLLPNLLAALCRANFSSPFPTAHNGLSLFLFKRRLTRLLLSLTPNPDPFVSQHLSLFVFIHNHRNAVRDLLRHQQLQRLTQLLRAAANTPHHASLAAFLQDYRQQRAPRLKPLPARDPLTQIPNFLSLLRLLQSLFHEHGYHASPELLALHHWESAEDTDLIHELLPLAATQPAPS